jgi:hypothetical protein
MFDYPDRPCHLCLAFARAPSFVISTANNVDGVVDLGPGSLETALPAVYLLIFL